MGNGGLYLREHTTKYLPEKLFYISPENGVGIRKRDICSAIPVFMLDTEVTELMESPEECKRINRTGPLKLRDPDTLA